jgi:hypothetical protein
MNILWLVVRYPPPHMKCLCGVFCRAMFFSSVAIVAASRPAALPAPSAHHLDGKMPAVLNTKTVLHAFGDEWGCGKRELVIATDDIVEVASEKFMYITPHASAMIHFVATGAPGFPEKLPKKFSLTRSTGLKLLMKLRNDAAWPPIATHNCTLFGDVENVSKLGKKPRMRLRGDEHPATVSIEIPAFGRRAECIVAVKRPEHPCDRIAIPVAPDVMDHILLFMHLSGFDEEMHEVARPMGTPKGVWWSKQRQCFLVPVLRPDGASGLKSVKTLEECSTILESDSMGAIADLGDSGQPE